MAATALHLMIPGLLDTWLDESGLNVHQRPDAPALEWLLAHADVDAVPASADAILFKLFGLDIPEDADLPVAAVTRLVDGGEADTGWWLRADPVHLRADQQGVFLVDACALAIEPAEVQALAAAFNHTFREDGLQLEALHPERWYLQLAADPGIRSYPLACVAGRDIRALLPYGTAKQLWHTRLTEIQMLFHTHPVNRIREEKGLPLLSGLWLWGGGVCPNHIHAPVSGVYAHDPLACGLARLVKMDINPVPDSAADWLSASDNNERDSLVVLEHTRRDPVEGDLDVWAAHIADLEQHWFVPCRQWVRSGALGTLRLYPGNGRCYTLTSAARWRFWRKRRSLLAY
ncbi:MAG: hypothetical protein CSA09_02220 [Candidatus Contendobacter odensis]|uniref:Phosphoglycerate mutase n=1 Tax=Candidatus Contendibacter odensensis TaxID=1400860 RepID=A0A2G6PFI4_9GAMM|nr:MAG: hypothetical protein CSA09_02220 [Candidatus Contendobacter odensis]